MSRQPRLDYLVHTAPKRTGPTLEREDLHAKGLGQRGAGPPNVAVPVCLCVRAHVKVQVESVKTKINPFQSSTSLVSTFIPHNAPDDAERRAPQLLHVVLLPLGRRLWIDTYGWRVRQ